MAESFEPGALLGHVYTLADGLPVRLRLARSSDAAAIKRLLAEEGRGGSDLDTARLVHFDPRRRYVVCATGLVASTELLRAGGAASPDGAPDPDLLVVGPQRPQELAELLRRALMAWATGRAA